MLLFSLASGVLHGAAFGPVLFTLYAWDIMGPVLFICFQTAVNTIKYNECHVNFSIAAN